MNDLQPTFSALEQPLRGMHAIEASAGTGKTYAITLLWMRLLLEHQLAVDRILVCTYTRAATAELRDRLRSALEQGLAICEGLLAGSEIAGAPQSNPLVLLISRLQQGDQQRPGLALGDIQQRLLTAQSAFDLAPISTIHGFCTTIIARHSLELGSDPDAELVDASTTTLDQVVIDTLFRHADQVALASEQARGIAHCVASEGAIDDQQICLPARNNRSPAAQIENARAALIEIREMASQRLAQIKTRTKLVDQGMAIIDGLINDTPGSSERWFTSAQERDVSQQFPELIQHLEALRHALKQARNDVVHEVVNGARRQYPQRKRAQGIKTFDDLLLTVRNALCATDGHKLAAAIRERFQAVMVDECQDSDRVQIDVFQRIFAGDRPGTSKEPTISFMVIGDPKQSIYRFRGADLSSYRALGSSAQRAPEMRVNWRSDGALISALNTLYTHNMPHFADQGSGQAINYIPVSAAAPVSRISDPWFEHQYPNRQGALLGLWSDDQDRGQAKQDLARQSAQECARLLHTAVHISDRHDNQQRRLKADDIAIIAHQRSDLAMVRRALNRLGIPAQFSGRGLGSVLLSDHAFDLLMWLEALAHSLDGGSGLLGRLLALISTPLYGLSADECLEFANDPSQQAQMAANCREQAEWVQRWGPLPTLLRWLHDQDQVQRITKTNDWLRSLTNWRHAAQILQDHWATGMRQPQALAQQLMGLMGDAEQTPEASMERLETDLPAVQLVTLHGSKGLEYPIVFCPFLWHLPSATKRKRETVAAVVRRSDGPLIDVIGSPTFDEHCQEDWAQQDEERQRLLYVALTRARHRCYVGLAAVEESSGHANGPQRSSLAQLLAVADRPLDEWAAHFARQLPVIKRAGAEGQTIPSPTAEVPAALASPPELQLTSYTAPRMVSFSALSHHHDPSAMAQDRDGTDQSAQRDGDPGLLRGLGSGIDLGNQIHDYLEAVIGNRRNLEDLFPEGGEADSPRQLMREALSTIMHAPLPIAGGDATCLSQLIPHAMAEMHFLFPVQNFSAQTLAQALLADPSVSAQPQRQSWAQSVADWPLSRIQGFMQGYIDLTFEYQGRWYVADYKTNLLAGYDTNDCEEAMLSHHYLLQGRLYLVALHRHLRHHLQDYDPQQHLGGMLYLFVRGLSHDEEQRGRGLWQEGVSVPGLLALDACLGGNSQTQEHE